MTSYNRTRELFGAALYGAAMMGNGSVTFKLSLIHICAA